MKKYFKRFTWINNVAGAVLITGCTAKTERQKGDNTKG